MNFDKKVYIVMANFYEGATWMDSAFTSAGPALTRMRDVDKAIRKIDKSYHACMYEVGLNPWNLDPDKIYNEDYYVKDNLDDTV